MSAPLLFALKALLAALVLAFVVQVVDPEAALAAAREAWMAPLLLALALVPANVSLEAYRWWRLVTHLAPDVRFRSALGAILGGYPLGLLTPGRVGEIAGRAALLRALPAGQSAALTVAEKVATLAAILVGGLIAVGHLLLTSAAPSPLWVPTVVFTALWTAVLLLAVLHPSAARAFLGAILPFAPVRRALGAFDAIPTREAVALLALSFGRYLIFASQFVLLVLAFAPQAAVGAVASGVALVLFAKSAVHSVTLGDLGVREGAAVFFLGSAGVSEAAALNASLAIFGFNLLLPALVGVPFLLRLRLSRSSAPAIS
ncbi:lysylphosphatidylglycerol synthase domain-containing protein [Rubricoccus marinus]|uniref:Flippase-like domain-containing protein n=1 Tax=Rubricoccus marinus TaxID=716817 RepID=A0A259TXA9_9BACT|nr:lysylphosphatidylglycerol synthase domain-containing protein [Rubricoccus marinus]OZC02351.1 hypothetical protein BSZ36_04785 [Rubricoccus marinus]